MITVPPQPCEAFKCSHLSFLLHTFFGGQLPSQNLSIDKATLTFWLDTSTQKSYAHRCKNLMVTLSLSTKKFHFLLLNIYRKCHQWCKVQSHLKFPSCQGTIIIYCTAYLSLLQEPILDFCHFFQKTLCNTSLLHILHIGIYNTLTRWVPMLPNMFQGKNPGMLPIKLSSSFQQSSSLKICQPQVILLSRDLSTACWPHCL